MYVCAFACVFQVYTCGECGVKIQGTVSIVRHLLAHDTTHDPHKPGVALMNGGIVQTGGVGGGQALLLNGEGKGEGGEGEGGGSKEGNIIFSEHFLAGGNGLVNGYEEKKPTENGVTMRGGGEETVEMHFMRSLQGGDGGAGVGAGHYWYEGEEGGEGGGETMEVVPGECQVVPEGPLENMQVEINPLDLLTTVMEEDQRSDNPVFPPEHFLLTLPAPAHFLEGAGEAGVQEEMAEVPPEVQEQEEETGSTEGYSDVVPSDILLDHPGMYNCDHCEESFRYQHQLVSHKHQVICGGVVVVVVINSFYFIFIFYFFFLLLLLLNSCLFFGGGLSSCCIMLYFGVKLLFFNRVILYFLLYSVFFFFFILDFIPKFFIHFHYHIFSPS